MLYNITRCDKGCWITMLNMLLYCTFWICPLCTYSCSAGFIHYTHSRKESPFPLTPPPLLPLGPSRLLRVPQSAAATAEDHCCHLLPQRRPQALKQPSSAIRRKHDLRQATLGRRKLVVSLLELVLHVFVDCLRYVTHLLYDVQYYPWYTIVISHLCCIPYSHLGCIP